jgi:hypothetical protein
MSFVHLMSQKDSMFFLSKKTFVSVFPDQLNGNRIDYFEEVYGVTQHAFPDEELRALKFYI